MNILLSLLGPIFSFAKGLFDNIFRVKQAKIEFAAQSMLQYYLKLRQDGILDQQTLAAGTQVLLAELQSEHWLLACWRPLTIINFVIVFDVVLYFAYHGIFPPPMNDTMLTIFGLISTAVGGYGYLRTKEKQVKYELAKQIANNISSNVVPKETDAPVINKESQYGPSSPNYDKTNPNLKTTIKKRK